MATKIKRLPVCEACGSDEVVFDAWAEWDGEAGNYILAATMDQAFCNGPCGGECSVKWVDALTAVEA